MPPSVQAESAVGFGLRRIGRVHLGGAAVGQDLALDLPVSVSPTKMGIGTLVPMQLLSTDHNVCVCCWETSWSGMLGGLNSDGRVTS